MLETKRTTLTNLLCGAQVILHLDRRPPIDPLDLVDTQHLLAVGVSDVGVDVVVVEHSTEAWVVVDTLAARAVDYAMRAEHKGATAGLARLAGFIELEDSSVHHLAARRHVRHLLTY